jgi:hypothetical protein
VKKCILAALAACCILFGGCSALLERSYSVTEPYADRYWDSGAEDTLRVDNYQDLVNSLLMLIEQRAEEAVIRCYDEVCSYQRVAESRNEVRRDTMQGSYLLQNIQFTFEEGANYGTAAFQMAYREDAEDLGSIMTLSDSQSLVDLLRLAVREGHDRITARFTYNTPREVVTAAVESYWQELCREEMEVTSVPVGGMPAGPPEDDGGEDAGPPPEDTPADQPEETGEPVPAPEGPAGPEEPAGPEDPEDGNASPPAPDAGGDTAELEPEPVIYPPCPWTVRFYPNQETAELVEILLKTSGKAEG